MIVFPYKYVIIATIFILFVFRIYNFIRQRKISVYNELLLLLIYIYSISVLYITVNPIILFDFGSTYKKISLVPFKGIIDILNEQGLKITLINVIGNFILFVPIGILMPIKYTTLTCRNIIVIALFSSTLIEILQYIFSDRVSDIDDIIINLSGAVIGYFLYKELKHRLNIHPL